MFIVRMLIIEGSCKTCCLYPDLSLSWMMPVTVVLSANLTDGFTGDAVICVKGEEQWEENTSLWNAYVDCTFSVCDLLPLNRQVNDPLTGSQTTCIGPQGVHVLKDAVKSHASSNGLFAL